jgi:hypothetical protein
LVDAGQVGDEHGRQRAHGVRSAGDRHFRAVHVHLAVADVVEPGPSHDGGTTLNLSGYLEGQGVDTVGSIGASAHNSSRKVASSASWATTDETLDDFPVRWILELSCVCFVGQGDLAGPSTVDCCVGTIAKFILQVEGGSCGQWGDCALGDIGTVARKVGAGGIERVFDGITRNWNWL